MLQELKRAIKYTLFNEGIKPFKSYYNAGRFPSYETAKEYGDLIEVSILDGCKKLSFLLVSTGETSEMDCTKSQIILRGSDQQKEMDRKAEIMLANHEAKLYKWRRKQLQNLNRIATANALPAPKSYIYVNESLDVINTLLTHWTNFEKANSLPLWLSWFFGVDGSTIVRWVQTEHFSNYLSKFSETERGYILAAWNKNLQYLNNLYGGFGIVSCEN